MYIGIDIGGTKTAVVLGTKSGQVLDRISFDTKEKDETLRQILDSVKKLMNDKVKAIGIS